MDRVALAIATIHEARKQPCPPIVARPWEPAALFATKTNMRWRKCGKRQVLDDKDAGPVEPVLLGPMTYVRGAKTEKKWTVSTTVELPADRAEHLGGMHEAFKRWLQPFFFAEHSLYLSRWRQDYRKSPRAGLRWFKARGGKFERTTEPPAGAVIMPTVERFVRTDEGRVFIELGTDIIVA